MIDHHIAPRRPRIYVVQDTDLPVQKATKFGDLEPPLLPRHRQLTLSPQPVVRELRHRLRNFTDHDFLLLVGNPHAIGMAYHAAASANNGRIKVLQWDKELNDYYPVSVDVLDRAVSTGVA